MSFWELIQKKLGCSIPRYIVNILTLQGYDNALSLLEMNIDDICQLEEYARSDKFLKRIPKDATLKDYLGTFHDAQKEFELIPGHRKLLLQVVNFVTNNFKAKGTRFFEIRESPRKEKKSSECEFLKQFGFLRLTSHCIVI